MQGNKCWHSKLWNWPFLPKLKCFIWLALEICIQTWVRLLKKCFQGPNICILCSKDEEIINHLFFSCDFSKALWSEVHGVLNLLENGPISPFGTMSVVGGSKQKKLQNLTHFHFTGNLESTK